MAEAVTLASTGDVATITLDRPDKRNALNEAMWSALAACLARADKDTAVKVVLIAGAGGHFAAGADIGEFEEVYKTRERAVHYAGIVGGAVARLAAVKKPVIAAIRGSCLGGGVAIALACDIRMAARGARFGITPAKLGLVYSLNDTKRLVDAVGAAQAKDLLFTGRIIEAERAAAIGLVDEIFEETDFDSAVQEKCAAIAGVSQWSVRKTKEIVRLILSGTAADSDETRAWFLDAVEQPDFHEGRDAFLAKRKPKFPFR